MKDFWSYDNKHRISKSGERWHFVSCTYFDDILPFNETPYSLYFRNDNYTIFGVIIFEKKKDNPYRDNEVLINKILNNKDFRNNLLDNSTSEIWKKSWK